MDQFETEGESKEKDKYDEDCKNDVNQNNENIE